VLSIKDIMTSKTDSVKSVNARSVFPAYTRFWCRWGDDNHSTAPRVWVMSYARVVLGLENHRNIFNVIGTWHVDCRDAWA